MIRTSFSTLGCPDWNWNDLLAFGPEAGYDGVEIRLLERDTELLQRPEFQSQGRAARRKELADAGFAVCGLGSSVRFDSPEAGERARQVDIGRQYFDLAAELGASFVRVFGDVLPKDADLPARRTAMGRIAEGLQQLGETAAALGLTVVIETHGDFSDSHLMREMLKPIESPAVGVLWDTHHPWRFCNEDLAGTFERLRPWIRHTHWKDSVTESRRTTDRAVDEAARQAHALMSGHQHADYVLFGDGEFPAAECMQLLKQAGYDGWFSLEWEKMWHPEIEDPEVALPPFPARIRQLWNAADVA